MILTPIDVAERLHISPSKARQLAAPGGPIPCIRIGRLIRFDSTDIYEYEQACRSITIKSEVDIVLSSTELYREEESELQSYFQRAGHKRKGTSSTGKNRRASTP